MKSASILGFLVCIFTSSVSASSVLISDYKEYRDTESLQMHVVGVGHAYLWSNASLHSRGDEMLFCSPSETVFNANAYLRLIDEEIQHQQRLGRGEGFEEVPVALALLWALQRRYTCQ